MILSKTCSASEVTKDATSQRLQGFLGCSVRAGRLLIISSFCIWNKLQFTTLVRGTFQVTLSLHVVICSMILGHACGPWSKPACYPATSQPGQRSPAMLVPVNCASRLPRTHPCACSISPRLRSPSHFVVEITSRHSGKLILLRKAATGSFEHQ